MWTMGVLQRPAHSAINRMTLDNGGQHLCRRERGKPCPQSHSLGSPLGFPNTAVRRQQRHANRHDQQHRQRRADLLHPGAPARTPACRTTSRWPTRPPARWSDSASSSAGTLAAGATCTEILSYSPTITGAVTGNLIFTDNSLNATNATQTVVDDRHHRSPR